MSPKPVTQGLQWEREREGERRGGGRGIRLKTCLLGAATLGA